MSIGASVVRRVYTGWYGSSQVGRHQRRLASANRNRHTDWRIIMRNIVVLSFISLDGVMQAPGGPDEDTSSGFEYGGWSFPYFDEVANKAMEEQMTGPFSLLLGRKTFDIFAAYWPQ